MIDLNNLLIFKKIVDHGSITKAALDLRIPKSAVSQKLTKLEADLGGRLLTRTTRSLSITEFGDRIYRQAVLVAEQSEAIREAMISTADSSAGLIRMTAPPDLGSHLIAAVLRRFMADYPDVRLELELSTRFVDLVNEGFDIAIRASNKGLSDSNLIAQKLHENEIKLFAGVSYLEAHGSLSHPDELKVHRYVGFHSGGAVKSIQLHLYDRDQSKVALSVTPAFCSNNFQGVLEAVKAGIGIGLLPEDIALEWVSAGVLNPVLPEWSNGVAKFFAVYPSRRFLPHRVKILLQYLSEAW